MVFRHQAISETLARIKTHYRGGTLEGLSTEECKLARQLETDVDHAALNCTDEQFTHALQMFESFWLQHPVSEIETGEPKPPPKELLDIIKRLEKPFF